MINNVVLMGRLTAEPEIKHTATDKSVTNFTVAVDSGYKDSGTYFIDCVAWEKTAEFICNYFGKGNLIAVSGSIQTRTFTDKNGNNRKATEINVSKADFTGERKENAPTGGTNNGTKKKADIEDIPDDDFEEIPDEDDLPF